MITVKKITVKFNFIILNEEILVVIACLMSNRYT